MNHSSNHSSINALIEKYPKLNDLNEFLEKKTGLSDFFKSNEEINRFKKFFTTLQHNQLKHRDMGDFQTPYLLTNRICAYLSHSGFNPDIIIEPTVGSGTFIISSLHYFPSVRHIYCIELQEKYEWHFKLNLLQYALEKTLSTKIEFYRDNIFTHQLSSQFKEVLKHFKGQILIIGNPPWVTTAELSVLTSKNIPHKSNIKRDRGIEAMTGRGNFDIAEYIIIQMVKQFADFPGKIAMLCKTSVIKNIVKNLANLGLRLSNLNALLVNSKEEFGISTEAALLLADLTANFELFCSIYNLYNPDVLLRKFGWTNNKFVSNIDEYANYKYLDGVSPFTWRQGVKHDAIKVMVLSLNNGDLINGYHEQVDIESALLYPLLRGSDLKKPVIQTTKQHVILTQSSLGENTDYLRNKFPKLWSYLLKYAHILDSRKSNIYKNKPRFSIFGIGSYAFKPYKIAISGFYKNPNFVFIPPIESNPVMLDDTCYYLSFDEFNDAFFTWLFVQLPEVKKFLLSIVFLNSKRPYTKEILMRIQLPKLIEVFSYEKLRAFYEDYVKSYYPLEFSQKDYLVYSQKFRLFSEKVAPD
ncbi:MAG: hypothetical protein EU536_02620 [Promethearchaeota archaeon]|nr:MAG: hypothetical protein EU536_02620 [Candidatus Lokiarchaeota archaeon]